MKWMENDALAREQMEIGWKWQRFVGAFFECHGFEVELPVFSFRKDAAHIEDYADTEDLMVNGERVEVKSRNLHFTSDPATFPYPRAFVDTVNSYDTYKVKPIAYVFVSQLTGGMLSTPGRHVDAVRTWQIEERYDNVRSITDRFYTVGFSQITGIDVLVKKLRGC